MSAAGAGAASGAPTKRTENGEAQRYSAGLAGELFPGALKRSFPRINAGAATELLSADGVVRGSGRGPSKLRINKRRSYDREPSLVA